MLSLRLSLAQLILQMQDLDLYIQGFFDCSFILGSDYFESMAQGPYCLHIGIGKMQVVF